MAGVNRLTGRSGAAPAPLRDGDKRQARQRVNLEVRTGRMPHPNSLPCTDCGHVWKPGERRHEYDHFRGYAAEHFFDVEPVCTLCHARRDDAKATWTHCPRGHPFDETNTGRKTTGQRYCRACKSLKSRVRPPGYWKAVNARRQEKLKEYRLQAKERRNG